MSIVHDVWDGHILVKPEHGRRVTVEDFIALATMPVLFDVGTGLSYVTHRILGVSG